MTATVSDSRRPTAVSDGRPTTPLRQRLIGAAFIIIVGAITLAPVLYVVAASFDISDLGAKFRFGLTG